MLQPDNSCCHGLC